MTKQAKTPVAGGACTVTSGPNKGKKGKYTIDEDGSVWCEGTWGGTQCKDSKCKSGAASLDVSEHFEDVGGVLVYEIAGVVEVESVGTFHCSVKLDADSGACRDIAAIPVGAVPLAELRESDSELDRMVAEAIGSHAKTLSR
jgi:hypothetical protein